MQASTPCELYVLHKDDFKQIFFNDFKDIGMEFAEFAYSRKCKLEETYKEAVEFLQTGGEAQSVSLPSSNCYSD